MKTISDPRTKGSQARSTVSKYRREEIEKIDRAIQECKAKGTSTYITVHGITYLVTAHGAMPYEGTATVAYSQSRQYREMAEKSEEQSQ